MLDDLLHKFLNILYHKKYSNIKIRLSVVYHDSKTSEALISDSGSVNVIADSNKETS